MSSGPNPAAERALELRGDRNGEAVAVFAAHHLHRQRQAVRRTARRTHLREGNTLALLLSVHYTTAHPVNEFHKSTLRVPVCTVRVQYSTDEIILMIDVAETRINITVSLVHVYCSCHSIKKNQSFK